MQTVLKFKHTIFVKHCIQLWFTKGKTILFSFLKYSMPLGLLCVIFTVGTYMTANPAVCTHACSSGNEVMWLF